MTDTKQCLKCEVEKPIDGFGKDQRRRDGRHPYCKDCRNAHLRNQYATNREVFAESQRWRSIKYSYGITKEQWMGMYEDQGGLCLICSEPMTMNLGQRSDPKRTCVDHCHDTGVVRGLLCNECNIGLGKFDHDPERLRKAAAYLGQP